MAQPTQLNPTEQDALVKQIGLALLRAAPADWHSITVDYRALGRYAEAVGKVIFADETTEELKVSPEIAVLFGRLRSGMYRDGRGTWYNARYQLDQPSAYSLEYDRDEPRWTNPPPPPAYADDLRTFPRDEQNVPEWLMRRMAGLKPPFRVARIFDGPGAGGRPVINRPPIDEGEREDILRYLDGAPLALPARGFDTDHLDDEARQSVPVAFHTDGAWIWPAAVNYYLRTHSVPPDPDLLEHLRRVEFTLPEVDDSTRAAAASFLGRGPRRPPNGVRPAPAPVPAPAPAPAGPPPIMGPDGPVPPIPVQVGFGNRAKPPVEGPVHTTEPIDRTPADAPGTTAAWSPTHAPTEPTGTHATAPIGREKDSWFPEPAAGPGASDSARPPAFDWSAEAPAAPAGSWFPEPATAAAAPAEVSEEVSAAAGTPADPASADSQAPNWAPDQAPAADQGVTERPNWATGADGASAADQSPTESPNWASNADGAPAANQGSTETETPNSETSDTEAPAASSDHGSAWASGDASDSGDSARAESAPEWAAGEPSAQSAAGWSNPVAGQPQEASGQNAEAGPWSADDAVPSGADESSAAKASSGPYEQVSLPDVGAAGVPARDDWDVTPPTPAGADVVSAANPPSPVAPGVAAQFDQLQARLSALGVPESRYRIGALPESAAWVLEQSGEAWRVGWFDGGFSAPRQFDDFADASAFLLGKVLLEPVESPQSTMRASLADLEDDDDDEYEHRPRRAVTPPGPAGEDLFRPSRPADDLFRPRHTGTPDFDDEDEDEYQHRRAAPRPTPRVGAKPDPVAAPGMSFAGQPTTEASATADGPFDDGRGPTEAAFGSQTAPSDSFGGDEPSSATGPRTTDEHSANESSFSDGSTATDGAFDGPSSAGGAFDEERAMADGSFGGPASASGDEGRTTVSDERSAEDGAFAAGQNTAEGVFAEGHSAAGDAAADRQSAAEHAIADGQSATDGGFGGAQDAFGRRSVADGTAAGGHGPDNTTFDGGHSAGDETFATQPTNSAFDG
ncbi:hypothetical protein SAMN05192558_12227, partial [Actinokineospora alba]